MKRYILLLTLLTITHMGYGQLSVGVAGGYTNNTLDADAGYYERDYSSMSGYSIAIPVQYNLCDWLALRTELGYMTKSYRWDRTYGLYEDYLIVSEYEEYRNGYISLPLMVNFSCGGERLRAFVNAGGWVGVWLNGRVSGEVAGFFTGDFSAFLSDECEKAYVDNRYEFDARRDNRLDAGLLCGVGAEYRLSTTLGIFAEGRYMYGLTDMQRSYQDSYPRYNTTILVQLGVSYSFNL